MIAGGKIKKTKKQKQRQKKQRQRQKKLERKLERRNNIILQGKKSKKVKKSKKPKYSKATNQNMLNYNYMREVENLQNNVSVKDYDTYLNAQNERQQKEYENKLIALQRQSVMKASKYDVSIFSSYLKDSQRNTRLFFISGHSDIELEPIGNRYTLFSRFKNMRYLSPQSIGRLSNIFMPVWLTDMMKLHPQFHKTLISSETDGDAKNLNFLFLRYLDESNPKKTTPYKIIKQKRLYSLYDTKNITDFRIYPKPKNPDLEQNPPDRTFNFYPNMNEHVLGTFEITSINEAGNYIIDDIMLSDELFDLFSGQFIRASTNMGLIIMACMRIPDLETMMLLCEKKSDDYLLKLNNFNSINRYIFNHYYLPNITDNNKFYIKFLLDFIDNNIDRKTISLSDILSRELSLKQDFLSNTKLPYIADLIDIIVPIHDIMREINFYTDKQDDIMIIDNGCFTVSTIKIPAPGNWNQSTYDESVKSYRPKRSKSANNQNNLNNKKTPRPISPKSANNQNNEQIPIVN